MAKILHVEDDLDLARVIRRWLEKEGHCVTHLEDATSTIDFLDYSVYDLLILDWELPKRTGQEVLSQYRQEGGTVPVLMLTARSNIEDKLKGFQSGADDYLTKPFDGREFMMRVNALLNRPRVLLKKTPQWDDLSLDIERQVLLRGQVSIKLNKKECQVLEFLMKRPEQIFPANILLNTIWADSDEGTVNALAACIARLRKKIDKPGCNSYIKNVQGAGYGLYCVESVVDPQENSQTL